MALVPSSTALKTSYGAYANETPSWIYDIRTRAQNQASMKQTLQGLLDIETTVRYSLKQNGGDKRLKLEITPQIMSPELASKLSKSGLAFRDASGVRVKPETLVDNAFLLVDTNLDAKHEYFEPVVRLLGNCVDGLVPSEHRTGWKQRVLLVGDTAKARALRDKGA